MLTLKIKAAANSVFLCTTAAVEAATPLGVASVADLQEREAAGGPDGVEGGHAGQRWCRQPGGEHQVEGCGPWH